MEMKRYEASKATGGRAKPVLGELKTAAQASTSVVEAILYQSPCVGTGIEAESKFKAAQQMYSISCPFGRFRTSEVGSLDKVQKPPTNARSSDKVERYPHFQQSNRDILVGILLHNDGKQCTRPIFSLSHPCGAA